jgi:DNA-binding winged helix-turn-helix (wHTH) protein
MEQPNFDIIASNLRALRDAHKYRLTYVSATRRPLDPHTELAELFFGRTIWLGPLSQSNALWSARRDSIRFSGGEAHAWRQEVLEKLIEFSWGYPSLLRACCEAYADGAQLESEALRQHPAVSRRAAEFWADEPSDAAVQRCGLAGQPLLENRRSITNGERTFQFDDTQLTAKENLLLSYLLAHPDEVCEKDDLVRAVWPEDVIFTQGVRDDSLAQLVRRLRVKIEPDPSAPTHIQTVPGRGYLFRLR